MENFDNINNNIKKNTTSNTTLNTNEGDLKENTTSNTTSNTTLNTTLNTNEGDIKENTTLNTTLNTNGGDLNDIIKENTIINTTLNTNGGDLNDIIKENTIINTNEVDLNDIIKENTIINTNEVDLTNNVGGGENINVCEVLGYHTREYWEDRYMKTGDGNYDWYMGADKVVKLFDGILNKSYKILNVGCGNSKMGEELYNMGYDDNNIYNLDFSENILKKMYKKYKNYNMKWFLGDITDNIKIKKNIFDVIIDKATLDTISCDSYETLKKAFVNIINILKVRGILILISNNKNILNYCNLNNMSIIDVKETEHKNNNIYIFILQKVL